MEVWEILLEQDKKIKGKRKRKIKKMIKEIIKEGVDLDIISEEFPSLKEGARTLNEKKFMLYLEIKRRKCKRKVKRKNEI